MGLHVPNQPPAEPRPLKVRNTFIECEESSDEELSAQTSTWGRAMTDPVDARSWRKSSEALSPIIETVSDSHCLSTASEPEGARSSSSSHLRRQPTVQESLEEVDSDSDISDVGQGPVGYFGRQETDEDCLYRIGTPYTKDTSSAPIMGPPGNWVSQCATATGLVPPTAHLDPGCYLKQPREVVYPLLPLGAPVSAQAAALASTVNTPSAARAATAATAASAASAPTPSGASIMHGISAQTLRNLAYPPEAPAVAMPQQLPGSLMPAQRCEDAVDMGTTESDAIMDESLAKQTTLRAIQGLSFSVTLADPSLPDCPLIGCSEGFEVLTGYQKAEIMGRNCRFLNQHVNLSVPVRRKLRDAVQNGTEFIGVLHNKRKNGERFRNLLHLTTLTVRGNRYIIGVQADAAQLPVDTIDVGHAKAVRMAAESIFSQHLDVWIQMEAREFSIRLPTPYSQLLKVVSPERYDQVFKVYVQVGNSKAARQPLRNQTAGAKYVDTPNIDCASTVALSEASGDLEESSMWSNETAPKLQKQMPGLNGSESTKLDEGCHLKSLGSAQHPNGCVECCFFFFGPSGCRSGVDCTFCHEFHQRKNSKKNRRLLRRIVDIGAVPNDPKERIQLVSGAESPEDSAARGDGDSSVQSTEISKQKLKQCGGADTAAGHGAAVRNSTGHGAAVRNSTPVLEQALPPIQLEGVADIMSLRYGEPNGRAEMQQIMLLVGVQVALPLRTDFCSPEKAALREHITFSVKPDLPRGVHFDRRTGLISGIPQEQMLQSIYVVTAITSAIGQGGMSLGKLPLTSTSFSLSVSDLQHYTMCFSNEDHSASGSSRLNIHLEANTGL